MMRRCNEENRKIYGSFAGYQYDDCYRKVKEQSGFVGWMKAFSFFFVHVAVILCLLAVTYIGDEYSYMFVPVAAGCVLLPCFYSAVYYLSVRLCNQYRVGLLIGMALCTSEFMQINFLSSYDTDVTVTKKKIVIE